MKFSLVVAALGIPCALALPSPSGDGNSLVARANPKLNQYSSLDDCKNDKNILFHAAPTTGNCYSFDGATKAFFVNTAGFLASRLHKGYGCSGESIGISYTGTCLDRGDWNSFVLR